ncbi:MAG: glycosyltransferase [Nitrospirota bacterium]|nr:glycosyltransferase [Nitrospirota bacterium]
MNQEKNNLVVLHVAPIQYIIDRQLYQGGTERVVHYLHRELIKLVTESIVTCCDGSQMVNAIYLAKPISEICGDSPATYQTHKQEYENYFEKVLDYTKEHKVSILHDHTGWLVLSDTYKRRKEKLSFPILTTLAPCYPYEKNAEIYGHHWKDGGLYFCVVSHSQKDSFLPHLRVDNVIYNGIDVSEVPYVSMEEKKGYLFNLGRIAWWKGQEIAIRVAKKSDNRVVIGGSISENEYFNYLINSQGLKNSICRGNTKYSSHVAEFLAENYFQAIYIGKLNDTEKYKWYKYALCFIMPILWDEPFGLVMIEAMACGTPVIAFNRGSVGEIIQDGKTGFIVETEDEMIEALREMNTIDSANCRRWVEDKFSSNKMARDYLDLYLRIIAQHYYKAKREQKQAAA